MNQCEVFVVSVIPEHASSLSHNSLSYVRADFSAPIRSFLRELAKAYSRRHSLVLSNRPTPQNKSESLVRHHESFCLLTLF